MQNCDDLLDRRYLLPEISGYFPGLVTQVVLGNHNCRHAFT